MEFVARRSGGRCRYFEELLRACTSAYFIEIFNYINCRETGNASLQQKRFPLSEDTQLDDRTFDKKIRCEIACIWNRSRFSFFSHFDVLNVI